MTITIIIQEQPNGDMAVGMKNPAQTGTALETEYYDAIMALFKTHFPMIAKEILKRDRN